MKKASSGDTVRVAYTGTLQSGDVFDSTDTDKAMEFTIGEKKLIPGFEDAVVGMEQGETKQVTIPSDQAYGQYNDQLVVEVTRSSFPDNIEPQIGQRLQAQNQQGQPILVTVKEIKDNTVMLDANHPLAGQDLNFEINLVEVK
jgi:FKBP-type peptidyl-prolyl cis-trans isomerase 2